jgi:hypothetical protein
VSELADGGRNAARGLRYQYLRTLEALMDIVEQSDHDAQSVHVEGLQTPDAVQADSVDYELINGSGCLLSVVQVKARAPGRAMGAGEIFRVLAALVRDRDACRYELLTNAAAGRSAEHLLAALRSDGDAETLRSKIDEILAGVSAMSSRDQLRRLDKEHLIRLRRAAVLFDSRDDAEIIDGLILRLRDYRNQRRAGLGEQSAGLMVGYLISEIFKRAGSAAEATFSIADFHALLLIDGAALAQTLECRDWGVVVGPVPAMPDIRRAELLDRIHVGLAVAPGVAAVSRCILTGLSGIGKTSLAASYVLDRADVYDAVFWADAESQETLASAFERIARHLYRRNDLPPPVEPEHLRDLVHAALSRTSGTWLMVLDNCVDPRLIENWIPHAGRGHVIVTTIDSTMPPKSGTKIEVGPMDSAQAVALLAWRLGPLSEHDGSHAQPQLLERLASELRYWPLALELAAAYLHGSGLGIIGIPEYLRRLKLRSFGDYRSIPPDYPRMLIEAIGLCLERVREQIDGPGNQELAAAAWMVIHFAAYLAAQRIPVYLLMSVPFEIDPDDNGAQPIVVDAPNCPAPEVVTILRAASLVGVDEPLPADGLNDDHDRLYDRTISVNAVLQEVIRAGFDHDPRITWALDHLAWHTERWLQQAHRLGAHSRLLTLAAHATAIEEHAARLEVNSDFVSYLRGNLASLYVRQQHNTDKAMALFRAEIGYFIGRDDERARNLTCQASTQLAELLCAGEPAPVDEVVSLLENAYLITRELAMIAPEGAAEYASHIRTVLKVLELRGTIYPKLAMLITAIDDLIAYLPVTPFAKADRTLLDAETTLDRGDPRRAAELCRGLLGEGFLAENVEINAVIRCEARRRLIEALAHMGDLNTAGAELNTFLKEAQPPTLFIREIQGLVHNAGLVCAGLSIAWKNPLSAYLLTRMLSNGNAELIEVTYPGEIAARIRLLRAADALALGQLEQAHQNLEIAANGLAQHASSSAQSQAWKTFADILREEINAANEHLPPSA